MNKILKYIFIVLLIGIIFVNGMLNCNPSCLNYTKGDLLALYDSRINLNAKNIRGDLVENITYPKIFKTNICSGRRNSVNVIRTPRMARQYIKGIDPRYGFTIQDISKHKREIQFGYLRHPWEEKGRITCILELTSNQTILPKDRTKYQIRNRIELLNTKIEEGVDLMAKRIPGFYAGRFDFKFGNDRDVREFDLQSMDLIDINGVLAMDNNKYYNHVKNYPMAGYNTVQILVTRFLVGIINMSKLNFIDYTQLPMIVYTLLSQPSCRNMAFLENLTLY